MDGCGIFVIACFTISSTPRGVLKTLLYSSLSDTPNKVLYSSPEYVSPLNIFSLHVAPIKYVININSMA